VEKDKPVHKVRKRWVIALFGFGSLITLSALRVPYIPDLGENAVSVWQSVLTNLGVGLISAALLLILEPKFRKVVSDSVTDAKEDVKAEVKAEVRAAVKADLDERLAPLTERITALYDAKLAEQQSLVADLANDFTHERVTQVLREADEMSALSGTSLRVQADDVPGQLHIGIELASFYSPDDWRAGQPRQGAPATEELRVSAYTKKTHTSVTWEPEDEFPAVAFELAKELNGLRARGLGNPINWEPVLTRFEENIKVAFDASHGVAGALPLEGALVEVAGPDSAPWYLTNEGLYHPSQNWSLPPKSFVRHSRGYGHESRSFPTMDKPSWADQKEWDYVVSRARSHFDIW
jgi:hypothetical protein